jgi:hypothetical protein
MVNFRMPTTDQFRVPLTLRKTYGLVPPLACVAAGTLGGVLIDGQPKTTVSDPA